MSGVPHIDGLPVVQVQIQNGERGSRPVMVVAQQLSSGQVIRTIEGPATDVSQMLSRRAMADVDSLFLPGDSSGARPGRRSRHGHAARRPDAGHHRRPALRQPARDDPAAERGDAQQIGDGKSRGSPPSA